MSSFTDALVLKVHTGNLAERPFELPQATVCPSRAARRRHLCRHHPLTQNQKPHPSRVYLLLWHNSHLSTQADQRFYPA